MTTSSAGLARMVALALLWGSNFLWISYSLEGFSPLAVTTLRLALGALVLLVVLRAQGLRLPRDRSTWGHLTVAAVVTSTLPYWLFAQAEQSTPSSLAGAINSTTPLWTLGFAYALRADRTVTVARITGLLIGFVGTLVLFAPWNADGAPAGALLALAASASYGVGFAYTGRYLIPRAQQPLVLATGQLMVATVPALVLLPFGSPPINSPTAKATIAILVLGMLGTGIAYVVYYRIITDDGPVIASTVTYLLPIVAIVLGITLNDEPFTWSLVVGSIVVVGGVVLTRVTAGRRPAPEVSARADPP